jgi:hypothetical protein
MAEFPLRKGLEAQENTSKFWACMCRLRLEQSRVTGAFGSVDVCRSENSYVFRQAPKKARPPCRTCAGMTGL